jgi:beta-lactamase class A
MFCDETDTARSIGEELVAWSLARFANEGLEANRFALTLLPFDAPLKPATAPERPSGYNYNGELPFYPCSVVKAFYLAAVEARLEDGLVKPHAELDRAMRDMILWSSNMATNYIIDLVTETTGDTLLDEKEMGAWEHRRHWVNRYFQSLGWPVSHGVNLCQKLMDDDRYGREHVFVKRGGNNHNRLTTAATAQLFYMIFAGRLVTPERSARMAALLHRPLDADFVAQPLAQVKGYFGEGLPQGSQLWSKAGRTTWTGDANASYRRHDAGYVVLPNGRSFVLVVFTEGQAISDNLTVLPAIAGHAASLLA